MKYYSGVIGKLILFVIVLSSVQFVDGQSLTSTTASFSEQTSYPVFAGKDFIYYFCGSSGHQSGSLYAASSGQQVTFTWDKFTSMSGAFSYYSNETGATSRLSGLSDGCYRVSFRDNGVDYQFRAWIMNGWITPVATITDSNCQSFSLHGIVTGADYSYSDLATNQPVSVNPGYKYIWESNTILMATIQNPVINRPPSINTNYQLQVTDRAGCTESTQVSYESIVPKAQFSWKTDQPSEAQFTNYQAPLPVQFVNESVNGDVDKYEWMLFKEKSALEKEGTSGVIKDSIMETIYLENPAYTYNYTGSYMVKLIAAKQSTGFTCRDTFYLKNYIVIDTSLVKVAPAFTPNGDGINDMLIIRTRSLQSLDFQVFNRWGRIVHRFRKNGYTPGDSELAAWDGKINGKLASPGVYFYVVDAQGRDGKRRRKKGYVELIW